MTVNLYLVTVTDWDMHNYMHIGYLHVKMRGLAIHCQRIARQKPKTAQRPVRAAKCRMSWLCASSSKMMVNSSFLLCWEKGILLAIARRFSWCCLICISSASGSSAKSSSASGCSVALERSAQVRRGDEAKGGGIHPKLIG